jgi:hypothetical protein
MYINSHIYSTYLCLKIIIDSLQTAHSLSFVILRNIKSANFSVLLNINPLNQQEEIAQNMGVCMYTYVNFVDVNDVFF